MRTLVWGGGEDLCEVRRAHLGVLFGCSALRPEREGQGLL